MMNKQNRNKLIDTEHKLMVATWKRSWKLGEKVKGLIRTSWQLQTSHRNVKYSIRNIINNIVITMHGISGGNRLIGDHFISYISV